MKYCLTNPLHFPFINLLQSLLYQKLHPEICLPAVWPMAIYFSVFGKFITKNICPMSQKFAKDFNFFLSGKKISNLVTLCARDLTSWKLSENIHHRLCLYSLAVYKIWPEWSPFSWCEISPPKGRFDQTIPICIL